MIDSVTVFAARLNQLNPNDDAFVLYVDDLVDETSPSTLEVAYPVIFRSFEAHPERPAVAAIAGCLRAPDADDVFDAAVDEELR